MKCWSWNFFKISNVKMYIYEIKKKLEKSASYLYYLVRLFPQLWLYKPQKMFLIHTCWMMNMCINFPDIIKITVWSTFLSQKLPIRIKHQVKIEFLTGIQRSILSSNHNGFLRKRSIRVCSNSKIINRNFTCSRRFSRWWHKVLIFPAAMTRSMWCRSVKKAVASATGKSSSFADKPKTKAYKKLCSSFFFFFSILPFQMRQKGRHSTEKQNIVFLQSLFG